VLLVKLPAKSIVKKTFKKLSNKKLIWNKFRFGSPWHSLPEGRALSVDFVKG